MDLSLLTLILPPIYHLTPAVEICRQQTSVQPLSRNKLSERFQDEIERVFPMRHLHAEGLLQALAG